jgi:ATP-dependent helicase Lhr and Lhr-like helicase
MSKSKSTDALSGFNPLVARWFARAFPAATRAQSLGWPPIARGESTLILAPTGSGKTLAAFLWAIDRLVFDEPPPVAERCRVVYVSPLKALAVDVERNLRAPLAGITALAAAERVAHHRPAVAVRTGDTPARDRLAFRREPSDILITTPESLYLLLTSKAREVLRSVEAVIVDEVHALAPTKRGAHLALSLERLEQIALRPPQRIGLSATQRPLDEVARFLGGVAVPPADLAASPQFRPVTIVDTAEKKQLRLTIEVPVEDMARLSEPVEIASGPAAQGPVRASIWPAIHPRLLEMIRSHRSTLIFVNSRRLAERLAGALNELAGEPLVAAHHGSIARLQRIEIEDRLKEGELRALVATSSLELGIDMGAIDLVVQIEAPPTVASGMQRIGRGGHQAGAVSEGVIFPKHRADLLAVAAIAEAMHAGAIEETRYPRNPVDVLAQQVVAAVALDPWDADALYDAFRRAAPFAELPRSIFDGVLDMLSGLYPSDEFAELRPRLHWDRIRGTLTPRAGARNLAIVNGGTIPDRGLYGVFLAHADKPIRVGELDEEMVFESKPGETFVLGASTWRIEEVSHDRVTVTPAPGEPGKMPFWHGDSAARSVEFGERIGQLVRSLANASDEVAEQRLAARSDLGEIAAANLLRFLRDQAAATGLLPDDRTVVVERSIDELGDWRVCVLSPLGGRVHAPWAMLAASKIREELAVEVETMWSDDGFVVRFPESERPPETRLVLPDPADAEDRVVRHLASTALFASRFRENAARALLLPRRRPGVRTPLWQQRKRAWDLLQVAARHPSFPIILETYRECLRDVFDMPALIEIASRIESRRMRVVTVDTDEPSPFAASLLFRWVANFIYDGDAPLAERRAHALALDHSQLRELLGEIELRDLLDDDVLDEIERELQSTAVGRKARHADGLHDLLLRIGDLSASELAARAEDGVSEPAVAELLAARRVIAITIAGEERFVAAEDAGRYRDGLGIPLPQGLPDRFLEPVPQALLELLRRYARTHAPFTAARAGERFGIAEQTAAMVLDQLATGGRLVEGEFRPGGAGREYCDREVLSSVRRRMLAKLRREVEAVEPPALSRLLLSWQGLTSRGRGTPAILDAIESLQGAPLAASLLERDILTARVDAYDEALLDRLAATGEVVWVGVEPLGQNDGRIALYLAGHLPLLLERRAPELTSEESRVSEFLSSRGASFFPAIHQALGGMPADALDTLWNLVWKGVVTNDSFHPLRAFVRPAAEQRRRRRATGITRLDVPAAGVGRWSLVEQLVQELPPETERRVARARQLLARYGVVTREVAPAEGLEGGFTPVYEVLKQMEERGKIRRGYFVAGVAATQFALPAALDLLRTFRRPPDEAEAIVLAATDPANPYGNLLPWPEGAKGRLSRSAGAHVVIVDGKLGAWLSRGEKEMTAFLPEDEPDRGRTAAAIASQLASIVAAGRRRAILLTAIDGDAPDRHPLAAALTAAGFVRTAQGLHLRDPRRLHGRRREEGEEETEDPDA